MFRTILGTLKKPVASVVGRVLQRGSDDAARLALPGLREVSERITASGATSAFPRAAEEASRGALSRLAGFARRRPLVTLGGLGALGYTGYQMTQEPPAQPQPTNLVDLLGPYMGETGVPADTRRAAFEQFLMEDRARRQQMMPAVPDLVSSYDRQAAAAQSALDNYLATTGAYAGNQAQAIGSAYNRLAGQLQQSAQDEFTRGQMTAADLEALYGNLAATQAATAAGAGQATPVSETAGLAAPSGAAATAPQTTRTYGRGLADYLGREAGIESAAIGRTAQSQALQGAAQAQSLNDYFAMQAAQAQYNLANELAAGRTDAERQQAMLQYERDMQNLDYESAVAQQMLQLELEDEALGTGDQAAAQNAAITAATVWNGASEELRNTLRQQTGVETVEEFVQLVYENPFLVTALGLG